MFVPKESDKVWMRNLFNSLALNGVWGTLWAVYAKISEDTLEVTTRNPMLKKADVEDNVDRVRIVVEAIGLKFKDRTRTNK